jgi:hypothetical protein
MALNDSETKCLELHDTVIKRDSNIIQINIKKVCFLRAAVSTFTITGYTAILPTRDKVVELLLNIIILTYHFITSTDNYNEPTVSALQVKQHLDKLLSS